MKKIDGGLLISREERPQVISARCQKCNTTRPFQFTQHTVYLIQHQKFGSYYECSVCGHRIVMMTEAVVKA